jgi:hypothetical protein
VGAAREQRIPLWSLVLAGWIVAAAVREGTEAEERETAPPAQPLHPRSLGEPSARELRVLPGLGEKRALAVVDARWERAPGDPPLLLGDLAGIGGVVESAVWRALTSGSFVGGSMNCGSMVGGSIVGGAMVAGSKLIRGKDAEGARAGEVGELDSR